ncbi:TIR domain-containing protein [Micrococcus luteus]|uniref:TIR domain-containing protein n=1 Tax=Micrococcus luteus TaxID=1270 RepID=UPI002551819F|nr:TIR domain-containing protein [Micrococcus luteus]MDK8178836.1 TIR domain-containing protein [Micrococcus luteus]
MAKSVFYSFHYDRDAWRVQQIIQMGALEGQPILNAQQWEEVKRKGDAAIKKWIADQMAYKSAVKRPGFRAAPMRVPALG